MLRRLGARLRCALFGHRWSPWVTVDAVLHPLRLTTTLQVPGGVWPRAGRGRVCERCWHQQSELLPGTVLSPHRVRLEEVGGD